MLTRLLVSAHCQHHAHLPFPPHLLHHHVHFYMGPKCLFQPEFAESVLVGVKHVPHFEAAAVSFEPLIQLLVVGVVS